MPACSFARSSKRAPNAMLHEMRKKNTHTLVAGNLSYEPKLSSAYATNAQTHIVHVIVIIIDIKVGSILYHIGVG